MRKLHFSIRTAMIALLCLLLLTLTGLVLAQQPAEPQKKKPWKSMLPVVVSPPVIKGEVEFSSPRFQGVTTFIPQLTLDFSEMTLRPKSKQMKVWHESEDPVAIAWEPYSETYTKKFVTKTYGIQQMYVALRSRYGYTYGFEVPFFYIPAGDFAVPDKTALAKAGWKLTEDDLPVYVENGTLRLGSENWGCDNMPYPAVAAASLRMVLPEDGNYHLRMTGTITTYDQLPDPTEAKYDAFEVHLDGELQGRYGNPDEPLDCDTERQVELNNAYDLRPYKGKVKLSLENHSRYDEFYNTYTDIRKVWVARGKAPASLFSVTSRQVQSAVPCENCAVGPTSRE